METDDDPKYGFEIYRGPLEHKSFSRVGPANIDDRGDVVFCTKKEGVRSRSKGPAVITRFGLIRYLNDDYDHRTDGPAIIWSDGTKEYRIYGEQIDPLEFFLKYGVM